MPITVPLAAATAAALLFTGLCWMGVAQVARSVAADAAVESALAEATSSRIEAFNTRLRLDVHEAQARQLLADVHDLLGVGASWTAAQSLDDLSDAADSLERVLPAAQLPHVPLFETVKHADASVSSLTAWTGRFSAMQRLADDRLIPLDRALSALREVVAESVRTVSRASAETIDNATLVAESERDASRSALDRVAAAMRAGENPIDDLADYANVVTGMLSAQHDAEAAAAAAAVAAAAATGSGGPGAPRSGPLIPRLGPSVLPPFVPRWPDPWVSVAYWFTGDRVARCAGDPDSGYGDVAYIEYYDIYSGVPVYYYNAATYSTVINEEDRYMLILVCA